jgi:hypothetical protein
LILLWTAISLPSGNVSYRQTPEITAMNNNKNLWQVPLDTYHQKANLTKK